MRTDDSKRFAELMTGIAELYGQAVTKAGLRLWWAALADQSIGDVEAAINAHVSDGEAGRFMPKPADILRKLEATPADQRAADEAQAMVAWQQLLEAIRSVGPYQDCPISDPRALAAIEDAGGWTAVCEMRIDTRHFSRRQFIDAYLHLEAPGTARAALGLHSKARIGQGREAQQVGRFLPQGGGAH